MGAHQILIKLKDGKAADAALVSWARSAPERCFIFEPKQLLRQPGGAARFKDSDIFTQGAEFRAKAEKSGRGGSSSGFRARSLAQRDAKRGGEATASEPSRRRAKLSATTGG